MRRPLDPALPSFVGAPPGRAADAQGPPSPSVDDAPAASTLRPARWWRWVGDQIACDLCPRACRVRPGQRAFCFSRVGTPEGMALADYGRSSGFCLDPVESMPLYHYHPGARLLAFGTIGCNLSCRYCQNWDIARAGSETRLLDEASPEAIAAAAARLGCKAVGLSFNDPTLWPELALDVAGAAHGLGLEVVAKTAGYIEPEPRAELFSALDAASVDLKGFTEDFYRRVCGGRLGPVLDTLRYIRHETTAWLEVVTLVVPGENDGDAELAALCGWVAEELGPDTPLHLNAYSPEHRMKHPPTPPETLARARAHARAAGLRYVYTANTARDNAQHTMCPGCGAVVVGREITAVRSWTLAEGACAACGEAIAGRFGPQPGRSVPKRYGVRLGPAP